MIFPITILGYYGHIINYYGVIIGNKTDLFIIISLVRLMPYNLYLAATVMIIYCNSLLKTDNQKYQINFRKMKKLPKNNDKMYILYSVNIIQIIRKNYFEILHSRH